MPFVFKSVTTVEFADKDILEAFVKTLPIAPRHQKQIMDGVEYRDNTDESGFPGAGKMIHTFSVIDLMEEHPNA